MIRKGGSRSLCQARKTRNNAFRKRNYFSCIFNSKVNYRRYNFNFGKEGTEFVSTNNAVFQDFSGSGAANMSKRSGSEIGKTHFRLGGENAPMRTVHQMEFREKSGVTAGKTTNSIAFQCTNFALGNDKVSHMPSSHLHYKYYPQGESGKLNRDQLNELRKEHFIYGKHPTQFKSVSQIAHGGYGLNAQRPIQDRSKTQSSSVQIGDPKLATTYFQTTYEVSNQSRPLGNNVFINNTIAKEGSHFQIGDSTKPIGKSQNQATYRQLDYTASKPEMDFEKRLRSNHFDLGLGNSVPGQYRSVSQAAHDFKGNSNEIRSKLDTDRKKDLTASHFQVGSDKVKMRSTMKGDYVDNGPSQAVFNDDKKRDLRNSHFMLGDPANVDFKSSHDIQYKWIQPRQVPV